MCVCVFGMNKVFFPGPSGSASYGEAVKVPGRGLSAVSATCAVCLLWAMSALYRAAKVTV